MNAPDAAAFERTFAGWRDDVDATLAHIAVAVPSSDPVSEALRYALRGEGKRLRPILCMAAVDAVGGRMGPDTVRAACAIELIHTYSLVHDDLPCMDDDDMRRGRATTHRAYGTAPAVLAGFALIPFACRLLRDAAAALDAAPERQKQVVRELCVGAGAAGMVGGQVLDLGAEHRRVSRAGLVAIHGMKTGALFRAALRIGGVLGAASGGAVDALGEFGARLGMAFQITDDVLDVTSETAVLGKTAGKDEGADKATFVSHMGVNGARAAADREVEQALAALDGAGLRTRFLEELARFAVSRDR